MCVDLFRCSRCHLTPYCVSFILYRLLHRLKSSMLRANLAKPHLGKRINQFVPKSSLKHPSARRSKAGTLNTVSYSNWPFKMHSRDLPTPTRISTSSSSAWPNASIRTFHSTHMTPLTGIGSLSLEGYVWMWMTQSNVAYLMRIKSV